MVLEFLRGGSHEGSFDHIVNRSVAMLADARHSFDLASLSLLTDTDPDDVASDIRATDERINEAERQLRSELIVHTSVHGTADIGSVLGFTLLLKKIERIGDQAKNILEIAQVGDGLAHHPESAALMESRQEISSLFAEAGELLGESDADGDVLLGFDERAHAMTDALQQAIDDLMTTERPGREVIPLVLYYRFLRRIVANIAGVIRTSAEPIDQRKIDDPED